MAIDMSAMIRKLVRSVLIESVPMDEPAKSTKRYDKKDRTLGQADANPICQLVWAVVFQSASYNDATDQARRTALKFHQLEEQVRREQPAS